MYKELDSNKEIGEAILALSEQAIKDGNTLIFKILYDNAIIAVVTYISPYDLEIDSESYSYFIKGVEIPIAYYGNWEAWQDDPYSICISNRDWDDITYFIGIELD